jgi:hypothetical protein
MHHNTKETPKEETKMTARAIPNEYVVNRIERFSGQLWAEIDLDVSECSDYEAAKRMPRVIEVDGERLGYSAFNSDRHVIIYRSGAVVATAARR